MTRRLTAVIALVLAGSLLASCSNTEEQEIQVKKPAKAAQKQAAPAAIDANAGISGSFESARLRNPFQSHIMLMKPSADAPQKIKGPLECCEVAMFRLMAAVAGVKDSEAYALIQAPDSKRYVIRHGDVMGAREGKVVKITSNSLVVREHTRDQEGKVTSTEDIEIKLLEKKL